MGSALSNPNASSVLSTTEPGVYHSSLVDIENGGKLISTFRSLPEARTLQEIVDCAAVKFGDAKAFGSRILNPDGSLGKYKFISFKEFRDTAFHFAAALRQMGISKGDSVGIYSHTCLWWQVTQYACHFLGARVVPIYDSLGHDAAQHIVTHSECKAIVCQPLKLDKAVTYGVKNIIVITDYAQDFVYAQSENESDSIVRTTSQLLKEGEGLEFTAEKVDPEDTAVIMYTSGSTGVPKGCVLTHKNLVAGGIGLGSGVMCSITQSDTYFGFLPLAHIYEFSSELCMLAQGAKVAYSSGNPKNLIDDLQAASPTIMTGVPRIFNRVYDSMINKIEGLPGVTKKLIKYALAKRKQEVLNGESTSMITDLALFAKFKNVLGGRLRLVVSGGAPILPDVLIFLKSVITPNIIQGYGLTENSAVGYIQPVRSRNFAAVGPVSMAAEFKFEKVEGMSYDPFDPQNPSGEIYFRGDSVFKEYFKDPVQTNEAKVDGWFRTGDVGTLKPDGHVQIIDRVKQLVKLSQGEYISLTNLSDLYSTADGVQYIYLYADSHFNSPVCVVVPTDEFVEEFKRKGIEELKGCEEAEREMLKRLSVVTEKFKLRGFERIIGVYIETEVFTIENQMLTPSLKPQMGRLRGKYEGRLIDLYQREISKLPNKQ